MINKRPIIIGIAGGSSSGKTTVAKSVYNVFRGQSIVRIEQDYYYKALDHLTLDERLAFNYDHPDAFDNELLIEHLHALLNGQPIDRPFYDYAAHTRSIATVHIGPVEVIILEGILVLHDERLRELMDIKLFVDVDADVRITRRILRDTAERGRTVESVIDKYLSVVKPMHELFVEPSKKYADLIIPIGGDNKVAIDIIVAKIHSILTNNKLL